MTWAIFQRTIWLAAITIVVGVVALAIAHRGAGRSRTIPGAVPVPGTADGYYTARAAPYGPTPAHQRTSCGQPFTSTTEGIASPVLPCGVKIYIRFQGKEVLTQIVDRGPDVPGRSFDIAKALADRLGLHGAQVIHWRYAR